ncbi:MAG: DNA-3-methyladenine glycosylase [Gemmatimonadota bacterium]
MSDRAWRSLVLGLEPLATGRLEGPAEEVAPRLLGCTLLSLVGGVATGGRIVEVEAYTGPDDPASHAAARIGRTARNAPMFGPPGRSYVYFVYGMHWCFNVVTGAAGDPQAVLVRAIEAGIGRETMARRRGRRGDLTNGPARLCEALAIQGEHNDLSLTAPPLLLLDGAPGPGEVVKVSPRIGIREAADWPLRFFLSGHPDVSQGRPAPSIERTAI